MSFNLTIEFFIQFLTILIVLEKQKLIKIFTPSHETINKKKIAMNLMKTNLNTIIGIPNKNKQ